MGAQKKSAAAAAARLSDDPEELAHVPLQAVLLADSFTTKFRPITLERPKVCLLPSASLIQTSLLIIRMLSLSIAQAHWFVGMPSSVGNENQAICFGILLV